MNIEVGAYELRFIYGRAGSGKTRFCLEEIKSRITSKQHIRWFACSRAVTFQAERDLISVLGQGVS